MKTVNNFFNQQWQFVLSAPNLESLPAPAHAEVAFAGRSNVGKSSLLNCLVKAKIARTSNTPGRTQTLNFFAPMINNKKNFLVDMPGYGYAKANKQIIENWTDTMFAYIKGRACLKRIFVLIDARHSIKNNDIDILTMLDSHAVSYQLVLTKIDKINKNEVDNIKFQLSKKLTDHPAAFPEIIATSAMKKIGLDELKKAVFFSLAKNNNSI